MTEPFLALKVGPFSCYCVHVEDDVNDLGDGDADYEESLGSDRSGERERESLVGRRRDELGRRLRALGEVAKDLGGSSHGSSSSSRQVPRGEEDADNADLTIKPRELIASALWNSLETGDELQWMHCVIGKLWPKVNKAISKMMRDPDLISPNLPAVLRGLNPRFVKFDLGQEIPRFLKVEVWEAPCQAKDVKIRGAEIHLDMVFESQDLDIELACGPAKASITKLRLKGELVLRLDPLVKKMPIVGGVAAYFLHSPEVAVEFGGVAHGVEKLANKALCALHEGGMQRTIQKMIESSLVLPNMIGVSLAKDEEMVDSAMVKWAKPVGMVRVSGMRARGLTGVDWHLFENKTSDPYVRMNLSAEEWTSSTVMKSCNPQWQSPEDTHDFLVYDREQQLRIEVHDWGMMKFYDVIGRAKPLLVVELLEQSGKEIPLYRGKADLEAEAPGEECGSIQLDFQWLNITPERMSPDGAVVSVKLDEVYLSRLLNEDAVKLLAKVVADGWQSEDRGTPLTRAIPKTEKELVRSQSDSAATSFGEAQEQEYLEIELESVISFVLPQWCAKLLTEQRGDGGPRLDLVMWLQNKKGKVIGRGTPPVDLREVRAKFNLAMSWPALAHEEDFKEYMQFDCPERHDAASYAMVTVHLQGVKKEDPMVAQADMERRRTLLKTRRTERSYTRSFTRPDLQGREKESFVSGSTKSMVERSHQADTEQPPRPSMGAMMQGVPVPSAAVGEGRQINWLNVLFAKIWPKLIVQIESMIENPFGRINMKLQAKMPKLPRLEQFLKLKKLRFTRFKFGSKPPEFGPLEVVDAPDSRGPGSGRHRGIELRFGFKLSSDEDAGAEIKLSNDASGLTGFCRDLANPGLRIKAGIKRIKLSGDLIVRLEPLLEDAPVSKVIGGVVVCFLDAPDVEMEFSGMAQCLEHTTLGQYMRDIIHRSISSSLVMPNVMGMAIGTEEEGVDRALLRQPRPIFVLRLKVPPQALGGPDGACCGCLQTSLHLTIADETWDVDLVGKVEPEVHLFLVFDVRQKLSVALRERRPHPTWLQGKTVKAVSKKNLRAITVGPETELYLPEDKDCEKPVSVLAMEPQLLTPLYDGLGDDSMIIVRIKVDEIYVPKELLFREGDEANPDTYLFGVGAAVRAKIGDEVRTTPVAKYYPKKPEKGETKQPGSPRLTRQNTLRKEAKFVSTPMLISEIPEGMKIELEVEFILFLLVPKSILDPEKGEDVLTLELVNKNSKVIGHASEPVKLAEVADRPQRRMRWQRGTRGNLGERMVFKDPEEHQVSEADIELWFLGLRDASNTDRQEGRPSSRAASSAATSPSHAAT